MSKNKFWKRPGTTDKGKDYENSLVAYYSLQLAIKNEINEFKISSNVNKSDNFDDLVLEIKYTNSTTIQYNIQAKQTNKSKNLLLEALKAERGKFSIRKWFGEFIKSGNLNKHKLILFTNRILELHKKTVLKFDNEKCFIIYIISQPSDFLNTSKKANVYKFQIEESPGIHIDESKIVEISKYREFFENFFLYTNQKNVNEIQNEIYSIFQSVFKADKNHTKNYLDFINKWSDLEGKKDKLNKETIKLKIAECLISPSVLPLSTAQCNDNSNLLKEAIDKFDITLITNVDLASSVYRSNSAFDDLKILNDIGMRYQIIPYRIKDISQIVPEKLALLLWLLNHSPLLLKVTNSNQDLIFEAIKLCEINEKKKKFILVGTLKRLQNWNIFYNLSDLFKYRTIYDKITTKFTSSFQGRKEIYLEEIINEDEEIRKIVTTDQLVLMIEGPINFGGPKETLPEHYIDRYLTKTVINFNFIDRFGNDDTIIISCNGKMKIIENHVQNFNFLVIDEYANNLNSPSDNSIEFFNKNNIFITFNEFTPKLFQEIREKHATNSCHHFRINSDDELEWIESFGNIDHLRMFRCYKDNDFVKETDIFDDNKIKVICADPGMGKSIMMLHLKNNYPSTFWVITIYLREYGTFFEKSRDHEQFIDCVINATQMGEFELKLIKNFKERKKIVIIWDGLDEISKNAFDNVLKVIEAMRKVGYFQWITARSGLRQILENTFKVLSRSIKPFDKSDQYNYIQKRLKSNAVDDLNQITGEIMKKIDNENLGVPLQIFLITELFRQNPEKCRNLLTNTFSITDLFGHFIEEKFNFFYKKANIDISNHIAKQIIDEHRNNRLYNYQIVALHLCLDQNILKILNINKCEDFLTTIKTENDYFGLMEVSHGVPNFAHRTYAEYFVALWLSRNYKKISNLSDFFFDESFKNVRFMFDLILAQNCPAHVAVLNKSFEGLKNNSDKINIKDKAGRSPLHIAVSWGETHPLLNTKSSKGKIVIDTERGALVKEDSQTYRQIINFLLTKCKVWEKDSLFGYNCLQYADQFLCLTPIEIIAKTYKIDFKKFKNFKDLPSVLYYLIKFNHTKLFESIEKIPYIETHTNSSLLHLIASFNRINFLSKVLESKEYKNSINKPDQRSWAPIHYASNSGNLQMIENLRKMGGDIHLGMKNGEETPIYVAAQSGQINILNYLIKNKAKVNVTKKNGWTPLMVATQQLNFNAIKLLITHKADVNATNKEGTSSLFLAARKGNLEIVEYLICKNAKVNSINKYGETPLYIVCKHGYTEIGEYLIANGASVNIARHDGWTPMMAASRNGHYRLVEILTKNGGKLNHYNRFSHLTSFIWPVKNKNLPTPLHIAAEKGFLAIVKFLIENGANVNETMFNGWTPLYKAAERGHLDIVKFLIENNAQINASLKYGWSPVFTAAEKGYKNIVEYLIVNNGEVMVCNMDGCNPLDIARKNGHEEVVEYFTNNEIFNQKSSKIKMLLINVVDSFEKRLSSRKGTRKGTFRQITSLNYKKLFLLSLLMLLTVLVVLIISSFINNLFVKE